MDRSLRKLMKVMPPLKGQRHTRVNWGRLEGRVGLTYPHSFKDFVSVYGSSHWFDKLLPFYSTTRTVRLVQEYVKGVRQKLKGLVGNMYDAKFNKWDLPLYPEDGGLFPFMADIDGPLYCWLTDSKSPSRWPRVLLDDGADPGAAEHNDFGDVVGVSGTLPPDGPGLGRCP